MKIVKIVLVLMLVMIANFSYYGVVNENGEKVTDIQEILQEQEENNILLNDEKIETEESKETAVSASKENEQQEKTSNVNQNSEKIQKVSNTQKQTTTQENKNAKNDNTTQTQTRVKEQNSEEIQSKANSDSIKENDNTKNLETSNSSTIQETSSQDDTKLQQIIPKQEEKIYCVDGGKIHIAGDGEDEHGYYKTWDEAFSAYEKYTEGWNSGHFKVSQCACGLYYFWATK